MSSIASPLWLSVRIAMTATLVTMLVGLPLAFYVARHRFRGRSLVEGIIMLPLVLPPTVVGYFLIILFGARGWIGRWLYEWADYSIMFRFEGAVLAAAVVALPLIYMPAKAAFATVDRELEDMARSLGANRLQLFWHVSIPLARRGLISGILLAFARALGEFGATLMVYGWTEKRVTLPISIWSDFERGQMGQSVGAVTVLSLLSLAIIMTYNASSASRQD
jgi:molybdate transport system permease protein